MSLFGRLRDKLTGETVTSYPEEQDLPEPVKVDDSEDVHYTRPPDLSKLMTSPDDVHTSYPEDRDDSLINDEDLPEESQAPKEFPKLQAKLKEPAPVGFDVPMGQHPQDIFVKHTSALESSGNPKAIGEKMTSGPHAGTSAISEYQIMPSTLIELGKNMSNKDSLLRASLPPNYVDREIEAMGKMNTKQAAEYIQAHPSVALKAVRMIGQRLDKFGGTLEDKILRYHSGTNLSAEGLQALRSSPNFKNTKGYEHVMKLRRRLANQANKARMQSSTPNKSTPLTSNDIDTEEGNS